MFKACFLSLLYLTLNAAASPVKKLSPWAQRNQPGLRHVLANPEKGTPAGWVHSFDTRIKMKDPQDPDHLLLDFGPVLIGQTTSWRVWDYDFTNGSFTVHGISGSSKFTMLGTTCINSRVACYTDVQYVPTEESEDEAILVKSYTPDVPPDEPLPDPSMNLQGTGSLYLRPPKCLKCKKGSILDVDSHSIREVVDIVGTDFSLVYSSAFTTQYQGPSNHPKRLANFNPEAWSVSMVHHYDAATTTLFLGDGTKIIKTSKAAPVSGQVYVMNDDDVYLFDSTGKHLQTKSYLTGFVKFSFTYTAQNKIWKITDSFNKVTTFNRNGSGILTSISSHFGYITTIVPTANGLIEQIQDPKLNTHVFAYNPGTELLSSFQKPNGRITIMGYTDATGWLLYEQGEAENFWDFGYRHNGTSPFLTTTNAVMAAGRTIQPETYFVARDANGKYTRAETASSGFLTSYAESSDQSRSTANLFESSTITTINDERFGSPLRRDSQIVEKINGLTRTTKWQKTTSLSNSADPYSYTQIINTTDVNANKWIDTYVKATKTMTSKTPLNVTTVTVFDAYERPTSIQLGNDTAKGFQYDTLGRLWKTTEGSSHDTTYAYNAKGELASITNALNETTQFGYDTAGRRISTTYPDLRVSQIAYNEDGQITGITPPGRPQHVFTFNVLEEPETYAPPVLSGVPVVNTIRSYNLAKQLTMIERPDGRNLEFIYNDQTLLDRIIFSPTEEQVYAYIPNTENPQFITSPQGVESEFTYFGQENILTEKQTRGAEVGKVTFTYDSFFRKKTRALQFDATAQPTITTTYRTDNQPSQIGAIVFNYDTVSGRVGTTTLSNIKDYRTYDTYGNLQNYSSVYQVGTSTPTALYSYSLTRDNIHRIIAKTETVQGITTNYGYTYDNSGRLKTVTKNGAAHSNYIYNSNSNRSSGTMNGSAFNGTYDNQDRLTAFTGFTYQHNANGEVTEIRNVSTNTATNFTTDAMGRITRFTTPTNVLIDYKLDWDGRRNVKLVNNVVQRRFIWEDSYRLGAEKMTSPAQVKEYVYGTSVNSPDYMKVGSTTYRILKDHLGSPRLVVRTSDGVVMQRMNYNEWGKVIEDTSPGFQAFGFAGGLYDQDSKLVHFGARDYDPATGRWMSKDPIGFDGGDVNLYGYVLNDPINFVDPEGLQRSGGTRGRDYKKMVNLIAGEVVKYSKNQINLKAESKACPVNTPIKPILPAPFSPTQPAPPACIMCVEQYDGFGQSL